MTNSHNQYFYIIVLVGGFASLRALIFVHSQISTPRPPVILSVHFSFKLSRAFVPWANAFIWISGLPQKLFDIATKLGFLGPAVVLDDLADVTLHIGRHGPGAVVVLVVTLAGIDMDEMVLDGTLNTTWHIIIDGGEADGHADGVVFGKQRTAFFISATKVLILLNENKFLILKSYKTLYIPTFSL